MIYDECKNKNITAVMWLTSRLVYVLEYVITMSWKKNIQELRPNLKVLGTGWMNYRLYRSQLDRIFWWNKYCIIDVYNATEGFFGYDLDGRWIKLLQNETIFYEFLDYQTWISYKIENISEGIVYILIITTSSGLYRYNLWDLIQYIGSGRFQFVWRTKEYLESFGEHITVDQTDDCIEHFQSWYHIANYSVGSHFNDDATWYHIWIIESDMSQKEWEILMQKIDFYLQQKNWFYWGKRFHSILIQDPQLYVVPLWTFHKRLESKHKLWGQFKVPKLKNNETIVNELNSLWKQ
jgi:hypothetical protein